jgi:DNA ligase-1
MIKSGITIGGAAASYPGFSALAAVCERLAATASRLEKRALIVEYLRSLNPENVPRGALYLAGLPFAGTDPRTLNIGGTLLTRVVRELTGADQQAMHAAYLRYGDLGSAAHDLLGLLSSIPERRSRLRRALPQLTLPQLTLNDIEDSFAAIAAAPQPAAKQRLAQELLERATPLEAKYWIKIVLADMRTGVKESLMEEAIAAAYEVKITQVRSAMMLTGNLAEVSTLAHRHQLEEARMRLFHPLGFMLASPVDSVEEALERFSPGPSADRGHQQALLAGVEEGESGFTAEPSNIGEGVNCGASAGKARAEQARGPQQAVLAGVEEGESGFAAKPSNVQMEDKYDGVRAQVHCGDLEQPGRVALFSRSREDMTASFPEIVEAFTGFPEPMILDGEILAWRPSDAESRPGGENAEMGSARALPFSSLQPRLGRKRVTAGMRESTPVIFMAFDLLYAGGELMLDRPLAERRRALEELVRRRQSQTMVGRPSVSNSVAGQGNLSFAADAGTPEPDRFARLVLAPAVQLTSALQLEQAYLDARAHGNEGVMLKARDSTYQPGRRGLAWLKLKRELATLDVVVTAAEYGHGKRAGTLSDYTFSVRDGDTLKVVGKAYSGLTDPEIARLSEFFLEHTLKDFGSARLVEPLVILEVAFNNVMRSHRHDSGFALRFPRILRIRDDKPVSEIDTLARVEEIYRSQD